MNAKRIGEWLGALIATCVVLIVASAVLTATILLLGWMARIVFNGG